MYADRFHSFHFSRREQGRQVPSLEPLAMTMTTTMSGLSLDVRPGVVAPSRKVTTKRIRAMSHPLREVHLREEAVGGAASAKHWVM